MASYKPPRKVRLSFAKPAEFRRGDRVRVKARVMAGRVGTFWGIMDGLAVVAFDNGQEMARRCREWDFSVLKGSLANAENEPSAGVFLTDLSNLRLVKRGGNTE